MIEVRPAPPEHYGWIAERARLAITPGFSAIEALDNGRIVGMVAYDGWTDNACSMHVALEMPIAARRLLRPAFGIPFASPPAGFGKGVVVGLVRSDNQKALAVDLNLGFRRVGCVSNYWAPGVHMIILEMQRHECRWL